MISLRSTLTLLFLLPLSACAEHATPPPAAPQLHQSATSAPPAAVSSAPTHAPVPAAASDAVLVNLRFSDHANFLPITNNPRANGSLPPAARDDSSWARVWSSYTPMTDDMGGGLRWLRAAVTRHETGSAQLKCLLPPLTNPASYRLTLVAASPANTPVALKIMQRGAPYRTFWSQRLMLAPQRATHVCEFNLPALTAPASLIISLGSLGVVDFYSLELLRYTEADLQRTLAQRYPRGFPANLVRASHFPLGWQAGWSMGVNASLQKDILARPRPDISTGRSTVPMHIHTLSPRGELILLSPPFELPQPALPHTLSFFVRGFCNGAVSVLADGIECAQHPFSISTHAFTRVVLPFRPARFAQFHILRITARGNFMLDALMVNPGSSPSNFVFNYNAEIALAHDWRRLNTFFIDELTNQSVRFDVRGAWPPGASLAPRVFNAYGDERSLPPIPLPAHTNIASGSFPLLPANDTRPLGAQRIEALLLLPSGEPAGPLQELVCHILPRPRYWGADAPLSSPFGIHCNVFEPHITAAKALGANWVRTHGPNGFLSYWSAAERAPGLFSFQDDYIQIMRRSHLRVLGVLTECPPWARIERPQAGAWRDNWWQPRDYAAFSNYAARIAQHFAGTVDHWQIWNEPWGGFWFKVWDPSRTGDDRWQPGPDPLGDYLRLSRMVFTAVKSANPRATIVGIGGTTWGEGKGGAWFANALASNGLASCDIPSFHVYHKNNEFFGCVLDPRSFWCSNLVANIAIPIRTTPAARARQLWMTEGHSTELIRDTALYNHTVLGRPDSLALVRDNAALLPLYHAVLLSLGVDKIFLYNMEATGFKPVTGVDWSVLSTKSGELNVAADAYAAMTWLLEDMRFVRRIARGEGVNAFVFAARHHASNPDRCTVLFAAENARPPIVLPAIPGAHYFDLFGNPASPNTPTAGRAAYLVSHSLPLTNLISRLSP